MNIENKKYRKLENKLNDKVKKFAKAHCYIMDFYNYPERVCFIKKDELEITISKYNVNFSFYDEAPTYNLGNKDLKNINKIMKCLKDICKLQKEEY